MLDWLRGKNKKPQQIEVKKENIQSEPPQKTFKEAEFETYLNKLVICVSNEVQNITVGYGKEIIHVTKAKVPMLVVYDIVDKKEIMPMGRIYDYSDQKFNALNKLEPNERIAILYKFDEEVVDKKLRDGEILYPPEVWAEKVKVAIEKWKQEQTDMKPKKIKP